MTNEAAYAAQARAVKRPPQEDMIANNESSQTNSSKTPVIPKWYGIGRKRPTDEAANCLAPRRANTDRKRHSSGSAQDGPRLSTGWRSRIIEERWRRQSAGNQRTYEATSNTMSRRANADLKRRPQAVRRKQQWS